jgi:membrane protein DedA with SNARE-associated domain
MNKKRLIFIIAFFIVLFIGIAIWSVLHFKVLDPVLIYINSHGVLLSFLGGFFTGETVIISLGFLSGSGLLPLWQVLIFCTLGMYLSDFIPFALGRIKFFVKLLSRERFSERAKRIEDKLLSYTRNNLFLTLLYTKFIYGASIPTLIYLGSRKKALTKFIYYDLLVEIIFVPIVVFIGWLSGKGFGLATMIFSDLRVLIPILLLIISAISLFIRWINKIVMKRVRKI